ncbi:MAG: hypothetical protein JXR40_13705 [Pontiellaceae bacterium]|nr:hypothetical protein [Pontiellaceae bacterium]
MLFGNTGIIKSLVSQRGYKHRRDEDGFTVSGDYAGNLQYVYSKESMTRDGLVVDLLYFAVDILNEKLVVGLFRENPAVENGVLENVSRSIRLTDFSMENLEQLLDKLIPPLKSRSI